MSMKKLFTLMLFMGGILTSCEKSDLEHENDFDKSYKSWLSFREAAGNSYQYRIHGSSWTGSSSETGVTVTNGKITQRHFKYTSVVGLANVPKEALEWTEDENEINSHGYYGAEALTLDQIYDKARSEWLIKRKNAKTYFETKNNGMISSCGYVEDSCADDCFTGITIVSIEAL